MPGNQLFKEMAAEVDRLEKERYDEIEAARTSSNREKDFIITLLEEKPVLDDTNIFTKFITQKSY